MQRYASAVYAVVLCLSVTSWYCARVAKHVIMQTMPHESAGTLVFWCQRFLWNSIGSSHREM